MSEEAIKRLRAWEKRMARAKAAATKALIDTGCLIVPSNNDRFCLIATRALEVRFIRITIDKISEADIETIRNIKLPNACIKEIWCRKDDNFEIREFLN
jgi:hypothetical protein